MSSSNYPLSPSLRATGSPSTQSRQASIVEMLSTPPPLENEISSIDINMSQTISKSPSATSISSLLLNQNKEANHSYNTYNYNNNSFSHSNNNINDSIMNDQNVSLAANLSRNPSTSSSNSQFLSNTSLEWQDILLSDLVEKNKLIVIDSKISVEKAFEILVKNGLTSVPVEESQNDLNCLTFDYTDLNAYLLLVLNKLKIENLLSINFEPKDEILNMIKKAQTGEQVPVSFVIRLSNKNPFIKLTEQDTLSTVVEILGTGVHRIAITKNDKLTGILSQRRLIKFLWDNARRFPLMEPLLSSSLKNLNIGSSNPVSIFGDQLLIEALLKMNSLKISSLAVIDRNHHLLGNISVTDVRLVSTTSKSDLLYKSCLHFISVILNSRGLENGKDSFPIFNVTPNTSLGRSIAKLVATKSHRLWIVKPENPIPQPPTQSLESAQSPHNNLPGSSPMHSNCSSINSEISSNNEKENLTAGKLIGVLSLTDILSVLAKTLGKSHVDPNIARKQRRRSSSSTSSKTNSSLEQFRKSISDSNNR